jgi:hypothetical protein
MSEIIDFIKTFLNEIIIIVVVVLFLLVLMNIKGIDLNAPKPPSKLVQQVTVETLTSMVNLDVSDNSDNSDNFLRSPADNFCESYLGESINLEKACNDLTETNCGNVKCCVYNNVNGKCVAGDMNGPTYKTDKDGKLITMDSYYYMGKKM